MVIIMDKLEEFKEFIKDKKFLSDKVNSGETSWQKLYETYDLFGKEADVFKEETRNAPTSLLKMLEGINLEKISENLEGMKKLLGVIGEFTKKDDSKTVKKSSFKTHREFDD